MANQPLPHHSPCQQRCRGCLRLNEDLIMPSATCDIHKIRTAEPSSNLQGCRAILQAPNGYSVCYTLRYIMVVPQAPTHNTPTMLHNSTTQHVVIWLPHVLIGSNAAPIHYCMHWGQCMGTSTWYQYFKVRPVLGTSTCGQIRPEIRSGQHVCSSVACNTSVHNVCQVKSTGPKYCIIQGELST
jgi:hypothetical protein